MDKSAIMQELESINERLRILRNALWEQSLVEASFSLDSGRNLVAAALHEMKRKPLTVGAQ